MAKTEMKKLSEEHKANIGETIKLAGVNKAFIVRNLREQLRG
ncbi:MAG: hypothetical protein NTV16_01555 [Actinobacteria bacterium]|nr:hypothetical protein [Actinomycetota bacterium]